MATQTKRGRVGKVIDSAAEATEHLAKAVRAGVRATRQARGTKRSKSSKKR